MNRIDRQTIERTGCEIQEEAVPGETWRWKSTCPFARTDVDIACNNCKHLISVGTTSGFGTPYPYISGDPVP
jgi:hypothetical protein